MCVFIYRSDDVHVLHDDLADDFVKKLLIITQTSRTTDGRSVGSHAPRSSLTAEISQAISDGLYFYEQVNKTETVTE